MEKMKECKMDHGRVSFETETSISHTARTIALVNTHRDTDNILQTNYNTAIERTLLQQVCA
jgi:3-isopropylmalate dehydratase small subunit